MAASDARIQANRQNASRSTGPKTVEGKAKSCRNALKHGLTGAGIVLPNEDVAEVERKFASYREEFQPTSEVGEDLVHRAALLSVRLDRSASHETAALRARIRQAEADFVAPDGLDAETVAQLKAEALALAMFDTSKEGILARRYEAAAERGYYRALKELRQIERHVQAPSSGLTEAEFRETLASFYQEDQEFDEIEAKYLEPHEKPAFNANRYLEMAGLPPIGGVANVPITVGKRR